MWERIFISETLSPRTGHSDVTWDDNRFCAKTLRNALRTAWVNPNDQLFVGLFHGDTLRLDHNTVRIAQRALHTGMEVVALGKFVSDELTALGIDHVYMVHPAAGGKIRKRENYQAHVERVIHGISRDEVTGAGRRKNKGHNRRTHSRGTSRQRRRANRFPAQESRRSA